MKRARFAREAVFGKFFLDGGVQGLQVRGLRADPENARSTMWRECAAARKLQRERRNGFGRPFECGRNFRNVSDRNVAEKF